MRPISLLLSFTISVLSWSSVDLFDLDPDAVAIDFLTQDDFQNHAQAPGWLTVPAPADGLQVVLDPVMIPDEPQFLVLQFP